MEGLTEKGCADLAASTDGGNFWTFKAEVETGDGDVSPSRCWVMKIKEKRSQEGLVSGNRACGVPGKYYPKYLNTYSCSIYKTPTPGHSTNVPTVGSTTTSPSEEVCCDKKVS